MLHRGARADPKRARARDGQLVAARASARPHLAAAVRELTPAPTRTEQRESAAGRSTPAAIRRRSARGQTIAIVDVGSTSLKLLVATLNERTGSISALHEEKRQVKLLSGARFSQISPEATERALAAFGHFCAVAAQFGVPLQAMATSGLRDADRADELIHKVQHKFGVTIQVISAQSEAVFVYNGAMLSAAAPMEAAMCMDMGGGSTEVCCGHSGRARAVSCIGIGSSRLANDMPTLLSSGVADRDEMLACMHDVRQQLQRTDTSAVRAELAALQADGRSVPAYGTSGTIKCIAGLIAAQVGAPQRLEGPLTPFTRTELRQFIRSLEGSTREARVALPHMKRKRVDAIVPGSILLLEVMNLLEVDDIAASVTGLREGIVSAFLRPSSLRPEAPAFSGDCSRLPSALTFHENGVQDGHLPLQAPSRADAVV